MITKEQMVEAIQSLPDGATIREAIERLEDIEMIEKGLADVAAGRTVSHAEARKRFAAWLK
jgi:predicted transcriptional regulator